MQTPGIIIITRLAELNYAILVVERPVHRDRQKSRRIRASARSRRLCLEANLGGVCLRKIVAINPWSQRKKNDSKRREEKQIRT